LPVVGRRPEQVGGSTILPSQPATGIGA